MEDDFSDLADITPKGTIARSLPYVHVRCDRPLVLIMKHAGASNPAYSNARKKREHEIDAAGRRGDFELQKAISRELFAHHVVVAWENARKKDGEPLPYSPSTAIKLFEQIIATGGEDKLTNAMVEAYNADNFRSSPEAAANALGK